MALPQDTGFLSCTLQIQLGKWENIKKEFKSQRKMPQDLPSRIYVNKVDANCATCDSGKCSLSVCMPQMALNIAQKVGRNGKLHGNTLLKLSRVTVFSGGTQQSLTTKSMAVYTLTTVETVRVGCFHFFEIWIYWL